MHGGVTALITPANGFTASLTYEHFRERGEGVSIPLSNGTDLLCAFAGFPGFSLVNECNRFTASDRDVYATYETVPRGISNDTDIVTGNIEWEVAPTVKLFSVTGYNVKGMWLVATEAARRMKRDGRSGSIINIASISGHRGAGGVAPYSVSKAAVLHLTRQLAWGLARDEIRVNSISPSYFETPLNREFLHSERGEALRARIAMRRFGAYSELGGAFLLLASSASDFMTGSDIVVDGGHLLTPL